MDLIPQLRTYDLLMDIAGAANVLGEGSYQALFSQASQGEQCDSTKCPQCLFFGGENCGNGVVQGSEQCDDGNRFPEDGCDEFCQIEGDYCGNGKKEQWELCDEGRECPNGKECRSFEECSGGRQRTCRYSGASCDSSADCPSVPAGLSEVERETYRRNSCRYAFDGVCKIGNIIEGSACTGEKDCEPLSQCNRGFCTNHPYLGCRRDADCTSCTFEEVWGTCYTTGAECNGDEDCPPGSDPYAPADQTDYCILKPESICRTRTVGGVGSDASTCGEYCEQKPYCGDGVLYLDASGRPEQCDDGKHCANGTSCVSFFDCEDGSDCRARDALDPTFRSCNRNCRLQICGDNQVNGSEQCDTGATCWNGNACDIHGGPECRNYGRCLAPGSGPSDSPRVIFCNTSSRSFCAPLPSAGPESNPCIPDESCRPRSDDGDRCDALCQSESCGDGVIQENFGERCDDGGLCQNGITECDSQADCPTAYAYCEDEPDRACQNYWDCPRGSRCVPANTSPDHRSLRLMHHRWIHLGRCQHPMPRSRTLHHRVNRRFYPILLDRRHHCRTQEVSPPTDTLQSNHLHFVYHHHRTPHRTEAVKCHLHNLRVGNLHYIVHAHCELGTTLHRNLCVMYTVFHPDRWAHHIALRHLSHHHHSRNSDNPCGRHRGQCRYSRSHHHTAHRRFPGRIAQRNYRSCHPHHHHNLLSQTYCPVHRYLCGHRHRIPTCNRNSTHQISPCLRHRIPHHTPRCHCHRIRTGNYCCTYHKLLLHKKWGFAYSSRLVHIQVRPPRLDHSCHRFLHPGSTHTVLLGTHPDLVFCNHLH